MVPEICNLLCSESVKWRGKGSETSHLIGRWSTSYLAWTVRRTKSWLQGRQRTVDWKNGANGICLLRRISLSQHVARRSYRPLSKRLLWQAMPELGENPSKPLLLHQFLSGLPGPVSRQLRATGDTKELEAVVQWAKVLMAVSDEQQTAAMTTMPSEVDQLKTQVTLLTEQVAELTTRQKNEGPRHCFYCNQLGHTPCSCPTRFRSQRCYICNRPGHYARDCWQGNAKGMSTRGSRHPPYQ